MIKIVIITPEWDSVLCDWTKEIDNEIHEWFTVNCFIIPFVPQIGMMIHLDDFFNCENILSKTDLALGYATVNQIIIGKDDITVRCINWCQYP